MLKYNAKQKPKTNDCWEEDTWSLLLERCFMTGPFRIGLKSTQSPLALRRAVTTAAFPQVLQGRYWSRVHCNLRATKWTPAELSIAVQLPPHHVLAPMAVRQHGRYTQPLRPRVHLRRCRLEAEEQSAAGSKHLCSRNVHGAK